jgi:diaminopimelate decarboxylase
MRTPFFTLDLAVAERAARGLLSAAGPDTVIAYAVKVNPQPDLLATFRRHRLWAEVVSSRELDLALAAGFPGAQVVVNGPAKGRGLLAKALTLGATVHLESLRQVEMFHRAAPVAGTAVGVRIQVPGSPPSRFGIPLEDLPSAVGMLAALGVNIAGLHAHFTPSLHGAGSEDWERRACALRAAARGVRAAVTSRGKAAAARIPAAADPACSVAQALRYLDWGGGIVPPDMDDPSAADFRRAAEPVIRFIERETAAIATELDMPAISPMVEPGRFLTEHAGSIHATCLDVATLGGRRQFVLDAGIGLLAAHDSWHGCYQASGQEVTAGATFAGPSCMEEDVLPERPLYGLPRVGGRVTLTRCGAYHLAGTTTFYHDPPTVRLAVR